METIQDKSIVNSESGEKPAEAGAQVRLPYQGRFQVRVDYFFIIISTIMVILF